MELWLGLVAGLIIGWIVEWIIDWRFWRNNLYEGLDQAERQRQALEDAHLEINRLREQLAALTPAVQESGEAVIRRDLLAEINGIGPMFEKRLHDAGIYTFVHLSETTPERIMQIIRPETWQRIEPESWIAQAKQRSQQSEQNSPPTV